MHVQTDPLRKFYTSLLAQRPDSEMAMKWWGRTAVSMLGQRGYRTASAHTSIHSQLDECVNDAFPPQVCHVWDAFRRGGCGRAEAVGQGSQQVRRLLGFYKQWYSGLSNWQYSVSNRQGQQCIARYEASECVADAFGPCLAGGLL